MSIEKKYISRIFVQNSIFNNIERVPVPKTMSRHSRHLVSKSDHFFKKVSFSYHFFEKSVVFLRLKCRKTTDSKMVTKKFTLHRNFLNRRFTAILLPFSYTLIVRKRQRSLKSLCRFLSIWNLECHFLTLFLNVF